MTMHSPKPNIIRPSLLYFENKKLLMLKESDKPFFMIPGGVLKKGETPEETIVRETQEELGVSLKNIVYFGEDIFPTRTGLGEILFIFFTGELEDLPNENNLPGITEAIAWIDSTYADKGIDVGNPFKMSLCEKLKRLRLIN